MDLIGVQDRLTNQYARLRDLRASENYPVYGIEHGLTPEEVLAAQSLLSESFRAYSRADEAHWLIWIAVAAEVGYRYDGTEYWDSFRVAIPKWLDRTRDRDKIREFYRKFATEFCGLKPSGPWAHKFPIIAWPITQAILPRYLQRHFASHLFELRHLLVKGGELTLDEIGDLLCDRYFGGSSLFEGFLQQKALTSRIVMALGVEDLADAIAPIEKVTLERITADIDALGSVGRRLREARRALRDARFINSAKPGFVPPAKSQASVQAESTATRTDHPRLVARYIDDDTWVLSLALPNLATSLRQAGLTVRDIEQSRMRIRTCSTASGWMPGRALFSYNGEIEEALDMYPLHDISVFSFDRPLETAQKAIQNQLNFSALSLRLLKIRADGAAVEMAGNYVRTDQSYLIVTTLELNPGIVEELSLTLLKSRAPPAFLWRIDVPSRLDEPKISALKTLGLGYRLGVRIEPLGLSPRWSTSNGALAFLDSEHALFSISSDVAVREYAVILDDLPSVRVIPSSNGTTFVSFGILPVGMHSLAVSAIGIASGGDIASEVIIIEVRASSPWKYSIVGKAGVALLLDPRGAPLEQFLDGSAYIRVFAPPRRTMKLNAYFYGIDGERFHDVLIGRYPMPISTEKLSGLIVKKLTAEAEIEHLERAAKIEISISLDEFGSATVAFEKEVEPLRWLRITDRKFRLSDDTGEDTLPIIERFDLEAVDVAKSVEYSNAIGGFELHGKGCLLVATLKGRPHEAITTVMQRQMTAFDELDMPAKVSVPPQEPRILIRALKRWTGARRLIGPMASLARRNAIRELERALAAALCGRDWLPSTDRVRTGQQDIGALYSKVWNSPGFAYGLAKFIWRYETEEMAAITEFQRLVSHYKLPVDPTLCRFALKLAFSPQSVKSAALQSDESFANLRSARALIRGAFFARLAADIRAKNAEAS